MVTQRELDREIDDGERSDRPMRRMLRSIRRRIEDRPMLRRTYRVFVGVLGGVIAVGGLLLVPLPGPGWLIVFLGLAILGTEFTCFLGMLFHCLQTGTPFDEAAAFGRTDRNPELTELPQIGVAPLAIAV